MARRRHRRGFTLLEVMIAMAILILALTALIGHEGVAIQMSDYSNRVSQATLLAQGKMLDLEHKLLKDSIDVLDNCEDGDFRDEDMRKFTWEACAYKIEIEDGAVEQLTTQVMGMITGFSGMDPSAMAGLAAGAAGGDPNDPLTKVSQQISMAMGAIPFFLQNLEDKVRKVRLVVKWKDAVDDRQVILERFVTSLGVGQQAVKTDIQADPNDPNAAGGAGGNAGTGGTGGTGGNNDDPLNDGVKK